MPPVAGYTPDATGFYVPPGGAKLLDIQTGQPVDTGKNFATPPNTPDFLATGVTPGSRQQVAIAPTDGGPDPTLGNLALYKGDPTGTGKKLSAPAAAQPAAPAPPGAQPPDTDHRPPPSPNAQVPAPAPTGDIQAFGQQVAAKYGVPWNVFYWAIQGESSWNPHVGDSSAGAQGIAQFIPGTAQQYGVNVKDPRSSLDGAARYLSTLYQQSGSWVGALTGYLTGDPHRQPPLDVLEQNPAYATAYRNAGYTSQDRSFQTETERTRAGYDQKAAHANDALQEALRQIRSGDADIGKAMERIRKAQDRADQAQDAAFKAIAEQPKAPVLDGVKHVSSIATIVGLIGGLFTKAPMLASTNAAAAAIEAYNAGDLRNYNLAHDNWKNQTDLLFKIADMNVSRVRDIMNEEKLPLEERRAKLDATLRAFGLQEIADNARIEGSKTVADWILQNEKLQADRTRVMEERDKPTLWFNQKDGKWYNVHQLSGRIDPAAPEGFTPATGVGMRGQLNPRQQSEVERRYAAWVNDPANATATDEQKADQHYQIEQTVIRETTAAQHPQSAAGERAASVQKVIDADVADYKRDNPNASKADVDRFAFQARVKHEQELAQATGRPARSPSAVYIQKWIEEHPGATADQVSRAAANYTQQQTVERTFASGPTSRNVQALNTVADHIRTVRELATAEKNGDIPRVNAIVNQLSVESGYEKVTNLQTASNIMSDEIVRLLTSTGGSETDRRIMESHFGPNMSPAQMSGALDVAEHMVAGRFKALEQAYATNDPARRQYFENTILTPEAREMFARNQRAAPSGNFGANQNDPIHLSGSGDVLEKAIADLPDGSYYVDPRDPAHTRQK